MHATPAGLKALGRTLRTLLDPAAPGDEVAWRRAASESVAELLRADHAYVQIPSAARLYVGTGIDPATFEALEAEFAETSARALRYRDPEMERLHRLGRRSASRVFTRESVSRDMGVRVEDTRIYREVCVPAGMDDFLGITSTGPLGDAMLWVSRKGMRGFGDGAVPALGALQPALDAALRGLAREASRLPAPEELRARFDLTPREAEVALLVARGASEKRVARTLGISPHTARHHTEKVFAKLGVGARGQVAAAVLGVLPRPD
ncbi:MAG: hypothetical protein AMXMBFR53_33770 [Gemmatimonadota bacterium]